MDRDHVLKILRDHEVELKRSGVLHIGLFGSVARGDSGPQSDIDILAEYDGATGQSLMAMGGIASDLAEWLGTRDFDLANAQRLRPEYRDNILRETIHAF